MPLSPGRGETPVTDDEADALLPQARELLDGPITKADVCDLEQAIQEQVAEELVTAVLDGSLTTDDLLADHFVRDLHRRLYGDIWSWAGLYRKCELNIGIAPELIATDLRASLATILYRWQHANDWSCGVGGWTPRRTESSIWSGLSSRPVSASPETPRADLRRHDHCHDSIHRRHACARVSPPTDCGSATGHRWFAVRYA